MDYALPVAIALAAWWLSTVVILYRAGLPRVSFSRTLLGAFALIQSRESVSPIGAYLAFFGAIAVYAWHEVSYLFGFVSGPRPAPCPPDCTGWRRFVLGVKTCAYHELAIVATAVLIAAVTWGMPNQVGLWTFIILWLMRWSAKLNIFLGVRNLHVEYWPEHLRYLQTFARERSMNELFPLSIIIATAGIALLAFTAFTAASGSPQRTGAILLATLLTLATLEHWFLIVRVPEDLLWRPGLRSRRS